MICIIMTSFVSFKIVYKTLEDGKDFDTLLIRREFITLYIPFLSGPPSQMDIFDLYSN